jgi:ABC-2 type transport system ATP-binding protein
LHNPDILILDEPTNGLDPGQIEHMRELIKALGTNATLLISTHILPEVEAVCDRVLILRRGRLALDARLDDLCDQRLLLNCDAAPQPLMARLQKLSSLKRIEVQSEQAGQFSYLLEPQQAQSELAPQVAAEVVGAGWQLFSLQPAEQSLEKLFHQITAGEVEQNVA